MKMNGEKRNHRLLGVYFLYFEDLLIKLKEKELTEKLQTIQSLWDKMMDRVHRRGRFLSSGNYRAFL